VDALIRAALNAGAVQRRFPGAACAQRVHEDFFDWISQTGKDGLHGQSGTNCDAGTEGPDG